MLNISQESKERKHELRKLFIECFFFVFDEAFLKTGTTGTIELHFDVMSQ